MAAGESETGSEYIVYVVERQTATHRIDLGHGNWLLVNDRDGTTLDFALFEFHAGPFTRDGKETSPAEHIMIFHGCGPGSSLRECRHIWWGEGGYTHSLSFALVESAFRALRRWYDGD